MFLLNIDIYSYLKILNDLKSTHFLLTWIFTLGTQLMSIGELSRDWFSHANFNTLTATFDCLCLMSNMHLDNAKFELFPQNHYN